MRLSAIQNGRCIGSTLGGRGGEVNGGYEPPAPLRWAGISSWLLGMGLDSPFQMKPASSKAERWARR